MLRTFLERNPEHLRAEKSNGARVLPGDTRRHIGARVQESLDQKMQGKIQILCYRGSFGRRFEDGAKEQVDDVGHFMTIILMPEYTAMSDSRF